MEDYEQYDGLGLAALVRTGEVCPEEILEAAIARIEAHNPLLNAVVTPMFDEARATVRAGLPSGHSIYPNSQYRWQSSDVGPVVLE